MLLLSTVKPEKENELKKEKEIDMFKLFQKPMMLP